MKKRILGMCMAAALLVSSMTGCGKSDGIKKVKLDPDNPVSLTI